MIEIKYLDQSFELFIFDGATCQNFKKLHLICNHSNSVYNRCIQMFGNLFNRPLPLLPHNGRYTSTAAWYRILSAMFHIDQFAEDRTLRLLRTLFQLGTL